MRKRPHVFIPFFRCSLMILRDKVNAPRSLTSTMIRIGARIAAIFAALKSGGATNRQGPAAVTTKTQANRIVEGLASGRAQNMS